MDVYKVQIQQDTSIIESIKYMDEVGIGFLAITDQNGSIVGVLTDGDFRRAVLKGVELENDVFSICNTQFAYVELGYNDNDVKKIFEGTFIKQIPVLNSGKLIEIIHKETYKTIEKTTICSPIDIPVIIMAGGKGTRLKPFTDVLPKPLVPIHEKPIMDWIIEEFAQFGISNFYATLNYRGKMIEAYYSSIEKDYSIGFKWEDDFYGTAGSLKLLKNEIDGTFIVSNCDIIVKADYLEAIKFHKESGAKMTVISSIQHHQIPYGVIEFIEGGEVTEIKEKPEYTHIINTGVYILEKECLDLIPDKRFFHITHLMDSLMSNGKKVMTYPVNEKAYVDIGQWEEYMSAVENFEF